MSGIYHPPPKEYLVDGKKILRVGKFIQTYSGRMFWPMDPNVDDIFIEDISESLSKICRFGGHSRSFYSVAQHCVLGSYIVEEKTNSAREALAFLLHDASEAYVGDVVRPLKSMREFCFYVDIENRVQDVIERKFGISFSHPIIHEIDNVMLATEHRDLMPSALDWGPESVPLSDHISPWSYGLARTIYLNRFYELTKELEGD